MATGLLEVLGLPTGLLPPLHDPGSVLGTLLPAAADDTGLPCSVPVIAVGSHDTASAVVLNDAARRARFTNEGGVDGTTRFLTNVMGLWMLSECVRQWQEEGVPDSDLGSLLHAAADLPESEHVFDVDDPSLLAQGDMPARVARLSRGERPPAETTRLILDSLADAYGRALGTASELAGVAPRVLHVVGGGSENALLCQLTADACGLPVVAGPREAAALGNVLVQARALGVPMETLADMRALLRRTQKLTTYEPRAGMVN